MSNSEESNSAPVSNEVQGKGFFNSLKNLRSRVQQSRNGNSETSEDSAENEFQEISIEDQIAFNKYLNSSGKFKKSWRSVQEKIENPAVQKQDASSEFPEKNSIDDTFSDSSQSNEENQKKYIQDAKNQISKAANIEYVTIDYGMSDDYSEVAIEEELGLIEDERLPNRRQSRENRRIEQSNIVVPEHVNAYSEQESQYITRQRYRQSPNILNDSNFVIVPEFTTGELEQIKEESIHEEKEQHLEYDAAITESGEGTGSERQDVTLSQEKPGKIIQTQQPVAEPYSSEWEGTAVLPDAEVRDFTTGSASVGKIQTDSQAYKKESEPEDKELSSDKKKKYVLKKKATKNKNFVNDSNKLQNSSAEEERTRDVEESTQSKKELFDLEKETPQEIGHDQTVSATPKKKTFQKDKNKVVAHSPETTNSKVKKQSTRQFQASSESPPTKQANTVKSTKNDLVTKDQKSQVQDASKTKKKQKKQKNAQEKKSSQSWFASSDNASVSQIETQATEENLENPTKELDPSEEKVKEFRAVQEDKIVISEDVKKSSHTPMPEKFLNEKSNIPKDTLSSQENHNSPVVQEEEKITSVQTKEEQTEQPSVVKEPKNAVIEDKPTSAGSSKTNVRAQTREENTHIQTQARKSDVFDQTVPTEKNQDEGEKGKPQDSDSLKDPNDQSIEEATSASDTSPELKPANVDGQGSANLDAKSPSVPKKSRNIAEEIAHARAAQKQDTSSASPTDTQLEHASSEKTALPKSKASTVVPHDAATVQGEPDVREILADVRQILYTVDDIVENQNTGQQATIPLVASGPQSEKEPATELNFGTEAEKKQTASTEKHGQTGAENTTHEEQSGLQSTTKVEGNDEKKSAQHSEAETPEGESSSLTGSAQKNSRADASMTGSLDISSIKEQLAGQGKAIPHAVETFKVSDTDAPEGYSDASLTPEQRALVNRIENLGIVHGDYAPDMFDQVQERHVINGQGDDEESQEQEKAGTAFFAGVTAFFRRKKKSTEDAETTEDHSSTTQSLHVKSPVPPSRTLQVQQVPQFQTSEDGSRDTSTFGSDHHSGTDQQLEEDASTDYAGHSGPHGNDSGIVTSGPHAGHLCSCQLETPASQSVRFEQDDDFDDDKIGTSTAVSKIFQTLLALTIPFLVLWVAFRAVASSWFASFEYYYRIPSPQGLSNGDRQRFADYAIDYLFNNADRDFLESLQIGSGRAFTLDEVNHMYDVKQWVQIFTNVALICAAVFIISLIVLALSNNRALAHFRKAGGIRKGLFAGVVITLLLLIIGILVFVLTGWNDLFAGFHEVLFPQGNWEFDSNSLLIKLFPGQFWIDSAFVIVILVFFICLFILPFVWPTKAKRWASKAHFMEEEEEELEENEDDKFLIHDHQ